MGLECRGPLMLSCQKANGDTMADHLHGLQDFGFSLEAAFDRLPQIHYGGVPILLGRNGLV